ncbi:unnamed protein product [Adineta steineri]|uniref:Uncharacterized protein n=1 Tax=Adineta steineri TaxID=433720 RepID=A0A816GAU2_9BILA|nr:unnamed protein product [Adineta steineri]CAF1672358.1 unnamed protein product [Adineta steineri]
MKANNRSHVNFDPSIRYTMWSIFIGVIFSSKAQYTYIQTQAQRYMSVKDTTSAEKVAWTNYVMLMYPLFVIETFRRFSGYAGLSIACILSATLSTLSSGANSIVTVIITDISKQLTKKHSM